MKTLLVAQKITHFAISLTLILGLSPYAHAGVIAHEENGKIEALVVSSNGQNELNVHFCSLKRDEVSDKTAAGLRNSKDLTSDLVTKLSEKCSLLNALPISNSDVEKFRNLQAKEMLKDFIAGKNRFSDELDTMRQRLLHADPILLANLAKRPGSDDVSHRSLKEIFSFFDEIITFSKKESDTLKALKSKDIANQVLARAIKSCGSTLDATGALMDMLRNVTESEEYKAFKDIEEVFARENVSLIERVNLAGEAISSVSPKRLTLLECRERLMNLNSALADMSVAVDASSKAGKGVPAVTKRKVDDLRSLLETEVNEITKAAN